MALPTAKTPPKAALESITLLMHGRPKIGKSTWASHSDNALFLATEPGFNSLEVYQQPIRSWDDLLATAAELATAKHSFRTVVLDTIDNAYGFCRDTVCKRLGVSDPADLEYGKGFSAVNSEWHRVLTKLASMPFGLYLISHSKEVDVETRTGTISKWVPTLPGKAAEIATGLVDVIVFADVEPVRDANGKEEMRRVLRTKPHLNWEAGDRTGRLPETLPLDYPAFAAAWQAGKQAKK